MGLMEKMANEKFQADKARADKIAKAIAAERKQDAQDRKGK